MGHRLSKIYTRTGDGGTTGLGDGSRVPKDSLRIEVNGDIDELNSAIGTLLAHEIRSDIQAALVEIQHNLFDLGSEVSVPGYSAIVAEDVTWLEKNLDALNTELPPLVEFILPAGGLAASACHMARAIGRRAERHFVALSREAMVNKHGLAYLNRLSDYLFVASRILARESGGGEVLWRNDHKKMREQAPSESGKRGLRSGRNEVDGGN
jgi:cob(I)alamin adenosyltransferase